VNDAWESQRTSFVNTADCGMAMLGGTAWPSHVGYSCSALDGVAVKVPPVSVFPATQSVGPGSVFVIAKSPFVGFP
jgi:hypothetical protein